MNQPTLDGPVPDSITPALGVRAWDIEEGPALGSLYRGVVWPRNQRLVAECLSPVDLYEGYKPRQRVKRWWLPGEVEKSERVKAPSGKHLSPHRGCSCGIYAAWYLDEAHIMGLVVSGLTMPPPVPKFSNRPKVYGAVAGWGRVIRGSKGFRAQYAKVLAFFTPRKEDWQDITELAELYDVPVVDRTSYRYEWEEA